MTYSVCGIFSRDAEGLLDFAVSSNVSSLDVIDDLVLVLWYRRSADWPRVSDIPFEMKRNRFYH